MTAFLEMCNGSYSFGEHRVLDNISFKVGAGEILCILGANGCGKTTLLRCINNGLELDAGSVYLEGRDIRTMDVLETARQIGFVYQEHTASFPFSVLEIVRMGRTPYLGTFESPSDSDTFIAEQALDMVGLLHYKNKPYTEISGGERQLILIARTLAQDPKIILLDEPTSHLDYKNQHMVLNMINRMASGGITVIMTSHMPNHALFHSSRTALMHRGKFIAEGPPSGVITEANLKTIYDMDVKLLQAGSSETDDPIRFCLPDYSSSNSIASGLPGVETHFRGYSRVRNGIAEITISENFILTSLSRKSGNVKVTIPSEGILLSPVPFLNNSSHLFQGHISSIGDNGKGKELLVCISGHPIRLMLSEKIIESMKLKENTTVYLGFKHSKITSVSC